MPVKSQCRIVAVGKRRDGGTRYWCLEHKADATAKYGRRDSQCRYSHIPQITPDEILKLDRSSYGGGVALWGAVPPIYDTTRLPIDHGIHVHARRVPSGAKEIDKTFRSVSLVGINNDLTNEDLVISELDAIYYMVSSVFGYATKYITCTLCGYPHLDKDWFSVHTHQRHLCAGCGRHFRDTDKAIGNPIFRVKQKFCVGTPPSRPAKRTINIKQADYPGGIQLWGSNPAVVWTARKSEEEGIHMHAFRDDSSQIVHDHTYSKVTIDGITLDPVMVRTFMAQSAMPHIAGRTINVFCPQCSEPHFDTGELAFTPHNNHTCKTCGFAFRTQGRMRNGIGNPIAGILARLAQSAPQSPQRHKTYLLPEAI